MDSINITQLVNHTGGDMEVRVFYNKALLDSLRIRSYKGFLDHKSERGERYLVSMDTLAMLVTYHVPSNAVLDLNKENGPEPGFEPVSHIEVQLGNTTVTYDRAMIRQAIKRKGGGMWEWKINR